MEDVEIVIVWLHIKTCKTMAWVLAKSHSSVRPLGLPLIVNCVTTLRT